MPLNLKVNLPLCVEGGGWERGEGAAPEHSTRLTSMVGPYAVSGIVPEASATGWQWRGQSCVTIRWGLGHSNALDHSRELGIQSQQELQCSLSPYNCLSGDPA